MFSLPSASVRLTPITPEEELLFTTLALQFGKPKPLAELRLHRGGGKSLSPYSEGEDARFVLEFSRLAHEFKISCESGTEFSDLYHRYEFWYGANSKRHQANV